MVWLLQVAVGSGRSRMVTGMCMSRSIRPRVCFRDLVPERYQYKQRHNKQRFSFFLNGICTRIDTYFFRDYCCCCVWYTNVFFLFCVQQQQYYTTCMQAVVLYVESSCFPNVSYRWRQQYDIVKCPFFVLVLRTAAIPYSVPAVLYPVQVIPPPEAF